ncbi:HEXXH motif-containing putative peptide modification protein [Actinoplanes sp. TFC3]|uniref:aKG-HExxH-type peptide beta-hydroxylase n=1 Tax=Actinoplanes sp. TFC3 TaxID=1710355 RepID=UPI001379DCCE|nr:HEXXH motif-containing putative peptide modification protein [Actinoplanes sp. TFC3]
MAGLGAGHPDAATIAELRRSQLSRHLLLLHEIAATLRQSPSKQTEHLPQPLADRTSAAPDEPIAALAAAEREAPARVRELLADPLFGVWAVSCLKALREGASPEQAGLTHLATLATAAHIPHQRNHDDRALTATHDGLTISVRLEDRDPLRAHLGLTPAPRLTNEQLRRWREKFTGAWRLLVTAVRPDAEVLAAVLTCIVPVEPDPAARGISATSADAFGAVAISEPADATALAVGLLHEAQHSILNAVQYLFGLLEAPGLTGYSPWRDDPRPASGILHGAYAYLTVTRFWRTQRRDRLAQFEFARWRAAVVAAGEGLRELTPAGARFVGALLDEVRPWLAEPVEPAVLRLAEGANRDHYLRWRLRNLRIEPDDVAALTQAWHAGQPPPQVTPRLQPMARRALEANARLDLTHRFLRGHSLEGLGTDPRPAEGNGAAPEQQRENRTAEHELRRQGRAPGQHTSRSGQAAKVGNGEADVAYVLGERERALRAYRKVGLVGVDWVGLIIAGGFDVAPEVASVLAGVGEPLEIVRWLS